MVAPLTVNNFNNSKSDIKFVEAATLGIPCLCQDMHTYSTAPDDLKFETGDDLEEKMDWILNYKNRKRYFANIPKLREYGLTRRLENNENIGCRMEALMTPFGDPSRKYLKKWNP